MSARDATPLFDEETSALQTAPLHALAAPTAAASAFARARARRPVLVALALYRHPELAEAVLMSLIDCAEDLTAIGAEVVIYNDSPDDEALGAALQTLLPQAQAAFACRLEVNPANLGFVRTMNRAFEEAVARGMDVLLLNSDTVAFPGAFTEMARVARLDPMIGFVNPRSNNATLATLPFQERFRHLPPQDAHDAWAALAPRLPELSYAPTGVGFCLLIRWTILAEFGGFDEIYEAGYNEENDLIMRAGRRGYRAVLANHAFVWHQGAASFGLGSETVRREAANLKILRRRYPEYWDLAQAYFDSAEQRADFLLGALLPNAQGRLEVAFDFSSFVPAHNGTFLAGGQLLGAAARRWRDRFDLYVICSPDVYAFHDYGRFGVKRRDVHDSRPFAAIFRVGQPFDWGALDRLVIKAPVVGVFMLDTISLDCTQLVEPRVKHLWRYMLEHADIVATTSGLTADQLERRFDIGPDVIRVRSLHSLDLADYTLPTGDPQDTLTEPGYLFVVGNHYAHKDVANAANALAAAFPERRIVVLVGEHEPAGGEPPADAGRHAPRGLDAAPNIVRLVAGRLTNVEMGALYSHAGAIVFPSHYEGFGIPVLNAFAARRPVFVRPLPVFEEVTRALGGDANLHVFATTADLIKAVTRLPEWVEESAAAGLSGDADRAADDIGLALDTAIARADHRRIVRRIAALQGAHDLAGFLISQPGRQQIAFTTPQLFLAHRFGQMSERAARRLLSLPGVTGTLRAVYRAGRSVMRSLRGGRETPAA